MSKQVYRKGDNAPKKSRNDDYDDRYLDDEPKRRQPTKNTKPKNKKSKGRTAVVVLLLLVLLGVGLAFGYFYSQDEITGLNAKLVGTATVVVKEGDSTSDIAKNLKNSGIIGSELVFTGYYAMNKDDYATGIQIGSFVFEAGVDKLDYPAIITKLSTPPPPVAERKEISVTFPESRSAIRFGLIAEEAFGARFTWQEFLEVANDMERFIDIPFIARLKEEGHLDDPNVAIRAEGFMAPNTYNFYYDATIEDIVRKLYEQFDSQLTSEHYQRMDELGITLRQAITLASIVEAESGDPAQQYKVSGVFWNRLQPGSGYKNLGSEITFAYVKQVLTVWYGLDIDDWREIPGNIFDAYHTEESNKDAAEGIPVGPYGAPGATAIDAALNPESHGYYFFLTTYYGEYLYAVTYEEHLVNKAYMEEENKRYEAENGTGD